MKGELNEAVQCDLCYIWVHAKFEGISKDCMISRDTIVCDWFCETDLIAHDYRFDFSP